MHINPDNPIVHALNIAFDALAATFLFLVCCIPVVTIGASVTAMQAVMMSLADDTCSGVFGKFFGVFRENFKQSTLLWLLAALVGVVVAADIAVVWGFEHEPGAFYSAMQGLTVFCSALYAAVFIYLFAGVAKYYVTCKQAVSNALIWIVKKPLETLGLLIVYGAMLFAVYTLWFWAFPLVALGLYLQAKLLNRAFGFRAAKREGNPGDEEIYYG